MITTNPFAVLTLRCWIYTPWLNRNKQSRKKWLILLFYWEESPCYVTFSLSSQRDQLKNLDQRHILPNLIFFVDYFDLAFWNLEGHRFEVFSYAHKHF